MSPSPGQRVGPYLIESQLGSGGMGVVYLARDTRMGRQVAIKFILESAKSKSRALERFQREIRTASAINHPGVCTVYDVGEHDGSPYLVMEYLEGESLLQRLKREIALPAESVVDIGIQVANALGAAHAKEILHRDIKPANVFLTRQGRVKLFDFGVAKRMGEEDETEGDSPAPDLHTATGHAMGTAQYLPPEQLQRATLDPRADIFSLGVVLYQCATGKLPFRAPVRETLFEQILNDPPAPFGPAAADCPVALQSIILKCLEKSPARRYQSAAELSADLELLRPPGPTSGSIVLPPVRTKWSWLWPTLAVLAVATTAGAYLWQRDRSESQGIRLKRLTANPVEMPVMNAAISHDGRVLAYGDPSGVSLLRLDNGQAKVLPGLAGYLPLHWDASGSSIVVSHPGAGTPYARMDVEGGRPPAALPEGPFLPIASPDGTHQIQLRPGPDAETLELWAQRTDGSAARKLLEAPRTFSEVDLCWLPGGRFVTFAYHTSLLEKRRAWRVSLLDVTSGKLLEWDPGATVNQLSNAVWSATGRILVGIRRSTAPQMQLWGIGVDLEAGNWAGELQQLSQFNDFGLFGLRSSPDGKTIVARLFTQQGDIFVAELDGPGKLKGPLRQLTYDLHDDFLGSWSADSKAVLFSANRYGTTDIFRQGLNDSNAEVLIGGSDFTNTPLICGNGRYLSYSAFESASAKWTRIMLRPLDGGDARVAWTTDKIYFTHSAAGICTVDTSESSTQRATYELDVQSAAARLLFRVEKPGSTIVPVQQGQRFMHYDRARRAMSVIDRQGRPVQSIPLPLLPGEVVASVNPEFSGSGVYLNNLLPTLLGMRVLYVSLKGEVSEVYRSLGRKTGMAMSSPDGTKIALYLRSMDSNLWLVEGL